jgi:hypothetical protein
MERARRSKPLESTAPAMSRLTSDSEIRIRNHTLRDLPLELNAVGTLWGHGFHPLKAQLTLSNH